MKIINNKQYNECSVVMLATEEKIERGLWLRKPKFETCSYLFYNILVGPVHSNEKYQHLYILSDEEIKDGDWCLYNKNHNSKNPVWEIFQCGAIESEEMHPHSKGTLLVWCKKIIGTTDSLIIKHFFDENGVRTVDFDLTVPQIPQSFIDYFVEQFNKGNVIDKVLVEYLLNETGNYREFDCTPKLKQKLKINLDNTINILPTKDSWSRDEVETILLKLMREQIKFPSYNSYEMEEWYNQWISKNL